MPKKANRRELSDEALLEPLLPLPDSLLIAVSGGIDSVVLLHALVAAGKQPAVLHFDHRWREQSADDADFVRQLAEDYGLAFRLSRARKLTAGAKCSEDSARQARYRFFAKEAERASCCSLVLAHHADDQVETFLLQLLRGSGTGRGGMRRMTERDGLFLIRPWLGIWRREITAYAKRHRLSWRDDATNQSNEFRRNRIRLKLLPYLQREFSEAVPEALHRAAEIQSAEQDWLDEISYPLAQRDHLRVNELRAMPIAQQRRVLRLWLERMQIADVSFVDVEAVRGLVHQEKPAKINLAKGRYARRRAGRLFIE